MSEQNGARIAWIGVLAGLAGSLLGVYLGLPPARLAFQSLVLGVTILWFLRSSPAQRDVQSRRLRPIFLPLIALTSILLLTTLTSTEIAASLNEAAQALSYLALLTLACALPLRDLTLRRLIPLFLLLGLLTVLVGIYLYWGGSPDMHGAFGNKNHFAGYLLLLLPLALAAYLHARNRPETLAYGATATLLFAAFLLSQSRGAWIALLPGLALLLWSERGLGPQRHGVWPRLGILAVLVLLIILLINQAALRNTVTAGADAVRDVATATAGQEPPGTLGPRLDYWQGALGIAADHPLWGTGPGTFGNVFPRYQRNPVYYSKYAHQVLLQTLAETGPLGLLALLWLLIGFTFQVSGFRFQVPGSRFHVPGFTFQASPDVEGGVGNRERRILATGLAAGLLSSFAHNWVELDWYVPAIALLAAIEGGLLLAIAGRETPRRGDTGTLPISPSPHLPAFRVAAVVLCFAGLLWAGLRGLEYGQISQGDQAQAQGDTAAALARYQAAARLNPLDAAPRKALAGLSLAAPANSAQQAAGLDAARQAVALARYDPEAHYLLARHYQQRGNPGDAEQAIQELALAASLRHPSQASYIFAELGRSYLATGRLAEARDLYRRVLAGYAGAAPGTEEARFLSQAHLSLGNIAAGQGDQGEADNQYRLALSWDMENVAARFNLGVLHYDAGELLMAQAAFEEAVAKTPDQVVFRYYLGLTYARLGDKESARAQWEAALRLDPACQPCQEELDRLTGK